MVTQFLERWKSLISGCLIFANFKKNISFWSVIFSYSMQQQPKIYWLDWDVQWNVNFIWQLAVTSSVIGPRRSSKAITPPPTPKTSNNQNQTCTKKNGHCLVVCCWSDSLQFSKLQWNHYIWKVHSANWWDAPKTAIPEASIDQQKGPRLLQDHGWLHITQPRLQKLNKLG